MENTKSCGSRRLFTQYSRYQRQNAFDFIMSSKLLSKADISLKLFSLIMLSMVAMCLLELGWPWNLCEFSTTMSHSVLIFVLNASQLIELASYIITK